MAVAIAVLAAALLIPLQPALWPLWLAILLSWVLLAVIDLLTRPQPASLELRRQLPPRDYVGRDGSYRLSVRNVGGRALWLMISERLPREAGGGLHSGRFRLAAGEQRDIEIEYTGLSRGRHRLLPLGVAVQHGLRLLDHRSLLDLDEELAIAPGRPPAELAWLLARAHRIGQEGQRPTRDLGAGWEFDSLREYQIGDELRQIDWKASARRHHPVVRQLELEQGLDVMLAIDCGRLMHARIDGVRKLDLAMTPLLDLAAVILRQGDRAGLLCFDDQPRAFLPPRSGMSQLQRMTDTLAHLPEEDHATSYLRAVTHLESRHRKPSYVLVFTDFTDEISAGEMFGSLSALARRHRLLFVAVGSPQLGRILTTPDDRESAIFERGVAGDLMIERRRALEQMERLGVGTIDAEPQRLSGPLLRRWIELRSSRLA